MPRYIIIDRDGVMDGEVYPTRDKLFTAMLYADGGSEIWELGDDAGRRITDDIILDWLNDSDSSAEIAAHKLDGRLPELAERRVRTGTAVARERGEMEAV